MRKITGHCVQKAMLAFALVALTACATHTPPPQVSRISPEELERIMPKPVPNVTLDEIVSLTKQGLSAEAIIEKIKASNSQYDLTPSEMLSLSQQGVASKVLDYIHTQREARLREQVAEEINKREAANKKEQEKLKRQYERNFYPYYGPFIHPYWGWGYSPHWRNRFYFGSGF